jgi:SAM-dependent methyltransferase
MTQPFKNEVTSESRTFDAVALEPAGALRNYVAWLLRSFRPYLKGRVLELGAGTGMVAEGYVDAVDSAVLVEPAENLFGELSRRFTGDARVKPLCGLLEELVAAGAPELAQESFDVAFSVNVLEHIRDDRAALELLRTRIKPGGSLLIFVPAIPFLYGELDARAGHFRRYTRSTLSSVVRDAGFQLERIEYFDVLGMLPWFVAGRVLRQEVLTSSATGTYDKYVVPLSSLADRILQKRIGKSLVCTARKPGP